MSGSTGLTLDISPLNGVTLDSQQYSFSDPSEVSTNRTGSSFVVNDGAGPAAVATPGIAPFSGSPIKMTVSVSRGDFYIAFQQSSAGVVFIASPAYVVAGWNADGVLLKAVNASLPPQWQYLIISDQDLSNGQTTAGGSNTYTNTDTAAPDIGGVQLTATSVTCFAAGTQIATPAGAVAIEDLTEGDLVCTLSGAAQPIVWIGRRAFDCAAHPNPGRVTPVQIDAGAFGPGLPARDLLLSPEHALFLDGALVPVHCLVNGTTIRQDPAASVTYYHLELPRHDVVLAEGLAAETYLETGSRQSLIRRDAAIAQAA